MTRSIAINKVRQLLVSLRRQPGYTLMRAFARFSLFRWLFTYSRRMLVGEGVNPGSGVDTYFTGVDPVRVSRELERDGAAFGLKLPDHVVEKILKFTVDTHCYADRNVDKGFLVADRMAAEKQLGKNILVAQYFNTLSECPEVAKLISDPVLNQIAGLYLKSKPTFVGANLWWTFPVDATDEDRSRHAHVFHRDVDDFRFFKFFFYLTDVKQGDGAHVCVLGSQGKAPAKSFLDRWNIRRYSDEEVSETYPDSSIVEVFGNAGEGFAEDTWCLHKGMTPTNSPRLLLQFQFALFDYGVANDIRDPETLKAIT